VNGYDLVGITGTDTFLATQPSGSVTQETNVALGIIEMHYQYFDSTPLANGAVASANFNIFGHGESGVSDTLQITVTGIADTNGDNTFIDLRFISGSLEDTVLPTALLNATSIWESNDPADPYIDVSSLIHQATGLSNANVIFASVSVPVPEPMTWVMLAIGLVAFGYNRSNTRSITLGLSA
jgi:hypothetical protein